MKIRLFRNLYFKLGDSEAPRCSAVIVAAGKGERMGQDKILMKLCGKTVLERAVEPFEACTLIDEIVIVTSGDKIEQIADICQARKFSKVRKVVTGGETREESSLAGVCETRRGARLIAIHDCARPLVTERVIMDTVLAASAEIAAVPGIPCTDTMKSIDSRCYVNGKINRDNVVRVQTPQVFEADIIKGSLTDAVRKGIKLTDDSSAVERAGFKVKIVQGDVNNIKLTTREDILFAEAILKDSEA